jgi:hypothetical protein
MLVSQLGTRDGEPFIKQNRQLKNNRSTDNGYIQLSASERTPRRVSESAADNGLIIVGTVQALTCITGA